MDRSFSHTPKVTRSQIRILAMSASGLTLNEIAEDLGVTTQNIYNQTYRAKKALSARTVSACVMRLYAMGLISTPTGADQMVVPVDLY
jgi:DNA-binding NarL/FixJ family response regulator